ncbi:MBL fold metallo-hydrolase [Gracilibacillus marinus]|uniref:MBL fold metallo-hydrolase n=1 Tax=Gracilibacillus marinus TaxID=630535 RepID=A0ABV8VWA0_9BACI
MKVDILASGSKGNCIALTAGNKTILVDAGIAKTKIEKRLLDVGITPNTIQAIFITHAHNDHVQGLPLSNKYKIPVFAAENEWQLIKNVDIENRFHFKSGRAIGIGNFKLQTFDTFHDSENPVGYAVTHGDFKVSICLDTGKLTKKISDAMQDSNIYIIESNHAPAMVEASDYPNIVKARVLSDLGHLSNEQTANALCKLIKGNGEHIYLTHLSHKNNMPALAEMTTMRMLAKKGWKSGQHYTLEVIT